MSQRSFAVRTLWLVLVGWWVTSAVVSVAWLLSAATVGIPFNAALVNLVSTMLSLKELKTRLDPDSGHSQRSVVIRAVYFVSVGWWSSWV